MRSPDEELVPSVSVDGVHKSYGSLEAVGGCSLTVEAGRITGLIGPNGSGKTTLFNLITGHEVPDEGSIAVAGHDIRGLQPHEVSRLGLSRTFQLTRVFEQMTVLENLVAAARTDTLHDAVERAMDLLELVELVELRDTFTAELSYGQRKLVEFARAHMDRTSHIILLDEPFAGINPTLAAQIAGHVSELRSDGGSRTYFLIDHEMKLVMELCDEIIVLDRGRVLRQGPPGTIQDDPAVLAAYFGKG